MRYWDPESQIERERNMGDLQPMVPLQGTWLTLLNQLLWLRHSCRKGLWLRICLSQGSGSDCAQHAATDTAVGRGVAHFAYQPPRCGCLIRI